MTALTLTAAVVAPGASAQNDSVAQRAEAWSLEPRTVSVESTGNGFSFTSDRNSELGRDRMTGAFDMQTATYRYAFAEQAEHGANVTMRLTFAAVIEYIDRNANGKFELGDIIVQYLSLPGHDGRRVFTPSASVEAPHDFRATYHLQPGGTLSLAFKVVDRPLQIQDRTFRPTQTGIEVSIDDFGYKSANSSLALETRANTQAGGTLHGGRLSGLYFADAGREMFYRWNPVAVTAAGPDVVGVTALEYHQEDAVAHISNEETVVMSYDGSPTITHGFQVGIRPASSTVNEVLEAIPGDWRVFLVGVLLTGGLIGGAAVMKMREQDGTVSAEQ